MTPEINELIKKITSAKGVTALLVFFFLGVFIWKNLDFLTEVSFTFKRDNVSEEQVSSDKEEASGVAQLDFGQTIVPPSPEKLPSIVVFEIQNPGSALTENVRVNIDLGVTKSIGHEVIGPKASEVSASEAGKPILNVDIKQLRPRESAYIYIHTTEPTFKRVAISSSNTTGVKELTLGEFMNVESGSRPTFSGFLLFLAGGFLLVMSAFFTLALISKLNKWMKLDW